MNVVIVPDSGATVACLLLALAQSGGLGSSAPASLAQLLHELIAQQRKTHQQLAEALQALALKSG